MTRTVTRTGLRHLYGAGPGHLLAVLTSLALAAGAATIVAGDPALLRMVAWFLAAVLLHDFVLFPLYAAADRALGPAVRRARRVPVVNHVRVPLLGAGLTFLLFLPGIVRQGEPVVIGQTGLDQSPFLGRWLVLVAGMAAVSACWYGVRLLIAPGRSDARGARSSAQSRPPVS